MGEKMNTSVEEPKKDKVKRPHTTGPVVPEDEQLSLWLHRVWSRGNVPEALEVWQVTGRNQAVRGE